MDIDNKISTLSKEVRLELEENILPFWRNKMTDNQHGGFYGRMDGDDMLHADAPKGAILNGRILWTFSAAYRLLGKPEYFETATRAKRYLIDRFYDKQYGGIYWSLDADGNPLDTKKTNIRPRLRHIRTERICPRHGRRRSAGLRRKAV